MIYDQIQKDMKDAMKARAAARLEALRYLYSELKNIAINEKVEVTDEISLKVIAKLARQRREGIEEFRKAGRAELLAKEEAELAILESYMPRALDEAELQAEVRAVIQELGATGKKEMGKVMKAALARLAGRADGKVLQGVVSSLLP